MSNKHSKQPVGMTMEEIYSKVFRDTCAKNRIEDADLSDLVGRWAEKNIEEGRRAMVKANVLKNLRSPKFSHRTFITGLQILNIEKYRLDLTLHYHNSNGRQGVGIDDAAEFNLAGL